jgi:hypothetical protein
MQVFHEDPAIFERVRRIAPSFGPFEVSALPIASASHQEQVLEA